MWLTGSLTTATVRSLSGLCSHKVGAVGRAGEGVEYVLDSHGSAEADGRRGGVGDDRLHPGHVPQPGGDLPDAASAAHTADVQGHLVHRCSLSGGGSVVKATVGRRAVRRLSVWEVAGRQRQPGPGGHSRGAGQGAGAGVKPVGRVLPAVDEPWLAGRAGAGWWL